MRRAGKCESWRIFPEFEFEIQTMRHFALWGAVTFKRSSSRSVLVSRSGEIDV
jgi:hypothetical protein